MSYFAAYSAEDLLGWLLVTTRLCRDGGIVPVVLPEEEVLARFIARMERADWGGEQRAVAGHGTADREPGDRRSWSPVPGRILLLRGGAAWVRGGGRLGGAGGVVLIRDGRQRLAALHFYFPSGAGPGERTIHFPGKGTTGRSTRYPAGRVEPGARPNRRGPLARDGASWVVEVCGMGVGLLAGPGPVVGVG